MKQLLPLLALLLLSSLTFAQNCSYIVPVYGNEPVRLDPFESIVQAPTSGQITGTDTPQYQSDSPQLDYVQINGYNPGCLTEEIIFVPMAQRSEFDFKVLHEVDSSSEIALIKQFGPDWTVLISSGPYAGSLSNNTGTSITYTTEQGFLGWDYVVLNYVNGTNTETQTVNVAIYTTAAPIASPEAQADEFSIVSSSTNNWLPCLENDQCSNPMLWDTFNGKWKFKRDEADQGGNQPFCFFRNGRHELEIDDEFYRYYKNDALAHTGRIYRSYGTANFNNRGFFSLDVENLPADLPLLEGLFTSGFTHADFENPDSYQQGNFVTNCFDCGSTVFERTAAAGVLEIISPTNNGSLQIYRDLGFYYTPDPDFIGNDSFTYRVCNYNDNYCSEVTSVDINVGEPFVNYDNQIPISDSESSHVMVTSNDVLPDEYSISVVEGPYHGSIDNDLNYLANYNYAGLDSFQYEVCFGGNFECQSTWAVLNVVSSNTNNEDETSLNYVLVECYDELTYLLNPSGGGSYCNNQAGTTILSNAINSFEPAGSDQYFSFQYQVGDAVSSLFVQFQYNEEACSSDIPTANDDNLVQFGESLINIDVLLNDEEGTEVAIVDEPQHGTATWNEQFMLMTYAPDPTFLGEDCFTYILSNELGSDIGTVCVFNAGLMPDTTLCASSIDIFAVFPDDASWTWEVLSPSGLNANEVFSDPTAQASTFSPPYGDIFTLQGTYNGEVTAEVEVELLQEFEQPEPIIHCIGETLELSADLPPGFSNQWISQEVDIDNIFAATTGVTGDALDTPGVVTIELQIYGQVCETSSSLLQQVIVSTCDGLPVTMPDEADNCDGYPIGIPIMDNDTVFGQDISVSAGTSPSYGTVSFENDGIATTVIYTPNDPNFSGVDLFEYIVTNNQSGESVTETVTVNLFAAQSVDFDDDCCYGFPCTIVATIPDGSMITFDESSVDFDDPNSTIATFQTDGLELDQTYLIDIEVSGLNCIDGSFSYGLSLPLCNSIPELSDDAYTGCHDTPAEILVAENDEYFGEDITLSILSGPDHGTAELGNDSESIIYFPGDGWVGNDQIQYEICVSGSTLCATATLDIQIENCVSNVDLIDASLQVFPNPSAGHVQLQSDLPIEYMLLMDAAGKRVWEGQVLPDILDVDSGIYFLEIESDGFRFVKKLVISK